jgi:hypothetical protein
VADHAVLPKKRGFVRFAGCYGIANRTLSDAGYGHQSYENKGDYELCVKHTSKLKFHAKRQRTQSYVRGNKP